MHELSLCHSLLDIIKTQSTEQGFKRVKHVWLEIGRMSGVEAQAMAFSFDVVMKDTLADSAELTILEVPGTAWCFPCGHEVEVQRRFDACPDCGSHQLQVTGGDAMRIKELEVY